MNDFKSFPSLVKNFELKVSRYQQQFDIVGPYKLYDIIFWEPRGLVRSQVGDVKVADIKVADIQEWLR